MDLRSRTKQCLLTALVATITIQMSGCARRSGFNTAEPVEMTAAWFPAGVHEGIRLRICLWDAKAPPRPTTAEGQMKFQLWRRGQRGERILLASWQFDEQQVKQMLGRNRLGWPIYGVVRRWPDAPPPAGPALLDAQFISSSTGRTLHIETMVIQIPNH